MKKFIKFDYLVFLVILGVSLMQSNLCLDIAGDMSWNFLSTLKIHNGFKIYKEFNVIITPLFFEIGAIFMKIFGGNFLAFNIYGIVIHTSLYWLIYILMKKIGFTNKANFLVVISLLCASFGIFLCNGANYNVLAIVFIFISMIMYIKNLDKRIPMFNVLQGILISLAILTKQNIGVFYLGTITVVNLLIAKNIREGIKNVIKQWITVFICMAIFLIWLFLDNNLYNFLNYAVFGVGTSFFENLSVSGLAGYWSIYLIVILTIGIGIGRALLGKNSEKEKNILFILSAGAIATLLMSIPIFNSFHMILATIISWIETFYILKINVNKIVIKEKIINLGIILVLCMNILYIGSNVYEVIKEETIIETDLNSPFYGKILKKSNFNYIEKIYKYIQDKEKENTKVIVISMETAVFTIMQNGNNGCFDILNIGNLGIRGEDGIIEDIKNMKNTELLILKNEDDMMYQESKKIRNYIMENLDYAGELEIYSIYKTRDI